MVLPKLKCPLRGKGKEREGEKKADRLLTMSEKEIKRLEVMRQLEDRRMKQGQAAEGMGMLAAALRWLLLPEHTDPRRGVRQSRAA